MSSTEKMRKLINLLEAKEYNEIGGTIKTTFELFPADELSEDEPQIVTAYGDVDPGTPDKHYTNEWPNEYNPGEPPFVENISVIDEYGKEIDLDMLMGNGARDWKVYKVGDYAEAMLLKSVGFDYEPTPIK